MNASTSNKHGVEEIAKQLVQSSLTLQVGLPPNGEPFKGGVFLASPLKPKTASNLVGGSAHFPYCIGHGYRLPVFLRWSIQLS